MIFPRSEKRQLGFISPPSPLPRHFPKLAVSAPPCLLGRWLCSSSFTLMALDDASNFQQIKSVTEQHPPVPAHTLLAQPVCVHLVLIHMVSLDSQISPPNMEHILLA